MSGAKLRELRVIKSRSQLAGRPADEMQKDDLRAGRKVPVLRTSDSLIRDEFGSLRSRFDEEMRLMEAEMARFKSRMMSGRGGGGKISAGTTTSRTTTKTTTSRTNVRRSTNHEASTSRRPATGEAPARLVAGGGGGGQTEQEFASSPLIVDDGRTAGGKILKLRFDVAEFEPDQIVVKTVDNLLQVRAERRKANANKSLFSEYYREFLLPDGTDPAAIMSTLSADGVLTIEAPLPAAGPL